MRRNKTALTGINSTNPSATRLMVSPQVPFVSRYAAENTTPACARPLQKQKLMRYESQKRSDAYPATAAARVTVPMATPAHSSLRNKGGADCCAIMRACECKLFKLPIDNCQLTRKKLSNFNSQLPCKKVQTAKNQRPIADLKERCYTRANPQFAFRPAKKRRDAKNAQSAISFVLQGSQMVHNQPSLARFDRLVVRWHDQSAVANDIIEVAVRSSPVFLRCQVGRALEFRRDKSVSLRPQSVAGRAIRFIQELR